MINNKLKCTFYKESGFTIFEVIIVILILGIIGAVSFGILSSSTSSFMKITNRSILLSEGRRALEVLRRDIHRLSADSILSMQSDYLSFRDVNSNFVEYRFENNSIKKNTQIIAHYVNADPFQFLDSTKNTITTPDNLEYIRINLDLNLDNETVSLEEDIYARN